jgi:membrane protein
MSGMGLVLDPDRLPGLLLETGRRCITNRVIEMSAALAFYSALSLAPLVVIVLGVAGMVVDRNRLSAEMADQANRMLGHGAGDLVRRVAEEQHTAGTGTWATVIGLAALSFAASAVFGQLKDGLYRIWGSRAKPRSGWGIFLRKRLLSLAMVLALGLLLLISLLVSAGLAMIADPTQVPALASFNSALVQVVGTVLVTTLLFALVFKVLPEAHVHWTEAWGGGALTAILFRVGEWAIGEYLGRASVGSAYGAAGTLLVLLVWVYYSSVIIFAGAQFTQVWSQRRRRVHAQRQVKSSVPHGRGG